MQRTPRHRTGQSQRTPVIGLTALLACAIVVVELVSLLPVGQNFVAASIAPSTALVPTTTNSAAMAAAEATLQSGAGPAGGSPWGCSSALSVDSGVQCGPAATTGASPAVGPTSPTWTSAVPPVPAPRALGSMVYDVRDGYVLLFGGHSSSVDLKDTWKYLGGRWT
jgi:hypothetical protein